MAQNRTSAEPDPVQLRDEEGRFVGKDDAKMSSSRSSTGLKSNGNAKEVASSGKKPKPVAQEKSRKSGQAKRKNDR